MSFFNKYTVTICLFLLWIVVFDGKYSMRKQHKLNKQITELKRSNQELEEKLLIAEQDYKELQANKKKYAREKYFLSTENEDVFIIE